MIGFCESSSLSAAFRLAPAPICAPASVAAAVYDMPALPPSPYRASAKWTHEQIHPLRPLSAMAAGVWHALREVVRDRPLERTAAEVKQDEGALAIMRDIVRAKPGSRAEVVAWAEELGQRSRLTVLEHTALMYVARTKLFADEPEIADAIAASLRKSWLALTGKVPDDLTQRLPKMTLRKASREARVYHAASFQPLGALNRPETLKARMDASIPLRDYVPENSEIIIGSAALLAAALSSTGAWLVGSSILTYGVFSLSEAVLHKFAGHPHTQGLAGWIKKELPEDAPWLQRKWHGLLQRALSDTLERTRISHQVVHHGLTFREAFTRMFSSAEHKARVDAFIAKQDPKVAEDIREELYGSTLSLMGCLRVLRAAAPQIAALVTAGIAFGAPAWCLIPLTACALGLPLSMKKVHPEQHVDKETALAKAGPLLTAILQTRWAAWSTRNHELHHEGECNFNLAFAGADALIGTLVHPNLDDLFRMRDDGTLHY